MKIEKRGKYPGIKVHLDDQECQEFLKLSDDATHAELAPKKDAIGIAIKIGGKLRKLMAEYPTLLVERTPAEIEESLKRDREKIEKQLTAMKQGDDWKGVE